MNQIINAVLSGQAHDLTRLLREQPPLATMKFDQEMLVESIPHQLYTGDTPLHLAAAAVRLESAKALLKAGADADAANRRAARPLHYACDPRPSEEAKWRPAEQVELIQLLLAHGAQIDAPDKAGVRPLHRAVRARSPGAVRALLDSGCDARTPAGAAGSTPLHLAVGPTGASGTAGRINLQIEIIALLIGGGAKLTDVDAKGQTVVDRIRSVPLRQALSALGLLD